MRISTLRRHTLVATLFFATLFATLPASASWLDWRGKTIEGSGNIQKQERAVKNFHALAVSVSGKLEIRQGNREGVQIETDDNILEMLETVVDNGTLKIRPREKNVHLKTKTLHIIVYLTTLDEISLAGSGKIQSEKLDIAKLHVSLGGSGDIQLNELKSNSLEVDIGGSGNFSARGNVPKIVGTIGGSGSIEIDKLAAKDVQIAIGGSGSVRTWVTQSLSVSIGGSGDVSYYGDPKVSKSIAGSGSVTRRGAIP